MHNDLHGIHPRVAAMATPFLLAGTLGVLLAGQAIAATPEQADLTGDGTVNILDLSTIGSRCGLQAGQEGYRGGLNLTQDGVI